MNTTLTFTNTNGETVTAEYTEEVASTLLREHGIDVEQELEAALKHQFDITDNTKK